MKITPLDIRRKEFKRSMRGYSDEEVDIFLDEVADEFERLFQENMELQDRAHRLDDQISGQSQLRDALEKTLVSAQLQAEELRANAHKESELILRDAQLKARGIVNDSYSETQKAQQTLVQLKRLEEDFRFKFRSLLEGYLKLLDDAAIDAAGAETSVAAGAAAGAAAAAGDLAAAVPPAAPEAPALARETPAAVREVPMTPVAAMPVEAQPPLPMLEEEIPTEESEMAQPEVRMPGEPRIVERVPPAVAPSAAAEEATAESAPARLVPPPGPGVGDDSLRGFFFGRQLEDADDTFPGEDGIKKDKGRDFEW